MSQWLKLSLLTNDCNKSKNSIAQLLLHSVTQNKIYPEVRYFNKKKKSQAAENLYRHSYLTTVKRLLNKNVIQLISSL